MVSEFFDVIIVGAGFAGVGAAYHLSKKESCRILLLEKEMSFGMHASGRNAAMLRQASTDLEVARLTQETLGVLQQQPADWEDPVAFLQHGSCLLGGQGQVEGLYQVMQGLGAKAAIYPFGVFPQSIDPALQKMLLAAQYEGMLWSPDDGVVDIHALLSNLVGASKRRGVVYRFGSPVSRVEQSQGTWHVGCSDRSYRAKVLVNASGAWANQVAALVGLKIPALMPYRRHLYISEALHGLHATSPIVWDIGHELYFRPESGAILLCAGDEDPHPSGEVQTDRRVMELLAQKFSAYFPPLSDLRVREGWACLRTKVAGKALVVDWDTHAEGFLWVSGLGGHGVSASMGIGKKASMAIESYLNGGKKLDFCATSA